MCVCRDLPTWPAPDRIETPRLTLRRFVPDDAPAMKALLDRHRDALATWLDLPADEEPLDRMVTRLRELATRFETREAFHYALVIDDRLAGALAIEPIGGQGLLLGGWIGPDLARRGHMRAAFDAVCRIAFMTRVTRYVELRIRADNAPSQRLAASLGFIHEATLSGRVIAGGAVYDETIWTLHHPSKEYAHG